MRVGIAYPQTELGGDPGALRAYAVAAEELGFAHLAMFDHPINAARDVPRTIAAPPRGYDVRDPFHDPLVAFAHVAALTSRIELVTQILVLPQRQTVLVARQAADVALLSGGRLRLGVGAGYNAVEFAALGQDFSTRGARLDEQIALLRQLWTGEVMSHDGEQESIVHAASRPAPHSPVPIWIGGSSMRAFRRAAVAGDGFVFGYGFGAQAREQWRVVRELVEEQGRPLEDFRAVFTLLPEEVGSRGPADIEAILPMLRAEGATDVTVTTARCGLRSLDEHLALLAQLAERTGVGSA